MNGWEIWGHGADRARAAASVMVVCAVAACSSARPSADQGAGESQVVAGTPYRVEVTPSAPISPGQTAALSIQVFDSYGATVTAFDDVHTQKMHLIAVSSDLRDFVHVHPALGAHGGFTVQAPFADAQPYSVFAEYKPTGTSDDEQVSRAALSPIGAAPVPPALASFPAFDGSAAFPSTTGTTRIVLQRLASGMLMPGMSTTLEIAVENVDGSPATDLVDWLGMPGHAIILSEDMSTYIHAHAMPPGMDMDGGMGDMNGMSGMPGMNGMNGAEDGGAHDPNVLDIAVTLPKAGLYKMFVQVKRGNDVVTVPFVLRAMNM